MNYGESSEYESDLRSNEHYLFSPLLKWCSVLLRSLSYSSVDKTKLPRLTPPPTQHHSFRKNVPLIYSLAELVDWENQHSRVFVVAITVLVLGQCMLPDQNLEF